MTEAPRVSVVMTVHNGAAFLREAVDSLLAQGFADFELVVVENGSTDDSPAILASYEDPRIRVFPYPRNIGRTRALNEALRRTRGALIAVLDADDVAMPDRLERQVAHLDARPEVVLLGGCYRKLYVDGSSGEEVLGGPFDHAALLDALAGDNPFCHSATMFRRASAAAVGDYAEDLVYAQDYALWIALSRVGEIAILPGAPVVFMRLHPASATNSPEYLLPRLRDAFVLLGRAGSDPRLSPAGRRESARARSRAALRYARALGMGGNRRAAAGMIATAFRLAPFRCLGDSELPGALWTLLTR